MICATHNRPGEPGYCTPNECTLTQISRWLRVTCCVLRNETEYAALNTCIIGLFKPMCTREQRLRGRL